MLRNNEPGEGLWFTPGGRILRGETIEEAVRRVLEKETGITPNTITRIDVMEHIWQDTHTVTILHTVEATHDQVTMNDEHSDYKWVNSTPEDAHPLLQQTILESRIFQKRSALPENCL